LCRCYVGAKKRAIEREEKRVSSLYQTSHKAKPCKIYLGTGAILVSNKKQVKYKKKPTEPGRSRSLKRFNYMLIIESFRVFLCVVAARFSIESKSTCYANETVVSLSLFIKKK
jgi:hypothetical protein